ncbi:MAG: hypothetical protein P1P81_10455 [Desulfobulbales bacterium]|nr:hypothetical protein [Desulfobulbales bacterium]
MHEIKKEEFIANTAARIFAAMFHRPEIPASPKTAVDLAQDLWDELVKTRGWED